MEITNEQLEILKGAKSWVEKGWTQGAYGRALGGFYTNVYSFLAMPDSAVECVCTAGAVYRAQHSSDPDVVRGIVVPYLEAYKGYMGSVHQWNDVKGRTKEEVIALLDDIIAAGEKALNSKGGGVMAKIKVQIQDRIVFFTGMADMFEGKDIGVVCDGIAGSLEKLRKERRQIGCDSNDCPGDGDCSTIAAIQASVRLILKGQQTFSPEYMALSGYLAWCDKDLPDPAAKKG